MSRAQIQLNDGTSYDFERVCVQSKKDDIALAKAKMPGTCETKKYKLQTTNIQKGTPIALLTRWNGAVNIKNGFIEYGNNSNEAIAVTEGQKIYPHHFMIQFNSTQKGDSGGVITDYKGRIIGINCWSEINQETHESTQTSGGVKIFRALEMISFYAQKLK